MVLGSESSFRKKERAVFMGKYVSWTADKGQQFISNYKKEVLHSVNQHTQIYLSLPLYTLQHSWAQHTVIQWSMVHVTFKNRLIKTKKCHKKK